ncbi:MAG: helix-turn-helix domain-containing protein, partial [Candidatus Oleimicrobiaceae bacterium]
MAFCEVMRRLNTFTMRLEMVKLAQKKGTCESPRLCNTSRKAVRKWANGYREEGLEGLTNRKRAPKYIPHKTPREIKNRAIELRKTHPAWGPERSKMHYQLPISTKAIAGILRQVGLVRRKEKRWKKQKELRA